MAGFEHSLTDILSPISISKSFRMMLFGFSWNSSHEISTLMSRDVTIHDDSRRDTNINAVMVMTLIFISNTSVY